MAENTVVHIGENSPEEVAFKLLQAIAAHEEKHLGHGHSKGEADRQWLLDTYAECLDAVRGRRVWKK